MKGLPASALTVCALIGLWTVGGRLWPKSMSVRPPQYVVISLDGGGSLDMWQMSRAWALGMQQDTRRVRMTYFVSGVYLIEDTNAMSYEAPRQPRGLSLIGFGGSAGEVSRRVAQMRAAVEEGHEIANHAGGHFRGVDWTLAEWKRDITTLNRRMVAAAANDLPVSGFRAPGLTGNGAMYSALRDLQYRYDASRAAAAHAWPSKRDGLWQFTLARVRTVMSDASVISMDYSFYRLHSGASAAGRAGDPDPLGWQPPRGGVTHRTREAGHRGTSRVRSLRRVGQRRCRNL